jgi:hypothetical protein
MIEDPGEGTASFQEIQMETSSTRSRRMVGWGGALAVAALVQALGVWYAGGTGILLDVANVDAYALGALIVFMLAAEQNVPRGPGAAPTLLDWAIASPRLFRSSEFRSLLPAAGIVVSAGVVTAACEVWAVRAHGVPSPALPLVGTVLLVQPLVEWAVVVVLVGLALLLVDLEADLRFVAALTGYAQAPVPVVAALLFLPQLVGWSGAAAPGDPKGLVLAMAAFKLTQVWAVFIIARGLFEGPRGGVQRSAIGSWLVAATPFGALSLAKLAFWALPG